MGVRHWAPCLRSIWIKTYCSSGARRSHSSFYKHTAPLGKEDLGFGLLQTCCPAGAGGSRSPASTNMLPRWGRRIWASGFYKHAAPLGQADLALRLLQTYCPAGAGGSGLRASTNMLPRWGRGTEDSGFYKHTAPLGKTVISGSSGPKPKAGTQRRGYHLLERYSLKH